MSNNIKYGSRILDMGVLLEMKALVNANGGVSRCIMECRQLACEVRHSQQLLDKLSCRRLAVPVFLNNVSPF